MKFGHKIFAIRFYVLPNFQKSYLGTEFFRRTNAIINYHNNSLNVEDTFFALQFKTHQEALEVQENKIQPPIQDNTILPQKI